MALIDYDSVEFANANRARIVATINSNTSSSWTAAIPVRFANTPYKVFRSLAAGVLNGNPRENDAGLPVKTLDDLVQRRASLALAAGASISAPAIPDEFDSASNWPMCPILLEIRDQSACGSCYAVSAASTATDRFCIYHNGTKSDRLSAVDLMSCCFTCKGGNGGCYGGTPSHCWDYMVQQGITSGGKYGDHSQCLMYPFGPCSHHVNGSYPSCPEETYDSPTCLWACDTSSTSGTTYDASQGSHKFATSYKVDNNMKAIQMDIMLHGPAQASMFTIEEFEVYHGGVFNTDKTDYTGAHAIKIVGWGVTNASEPAGPMPYWLIANSWNEDWGEQGFFRIRRGSNECDIESKVVAGIPA